MILKSENFVNVAKSTSISRYTLLCLIDTFSKVKEYEKKLKTGTFEIYFYLDHQL